MELIHSQEIDDFLHRTNGRFIFFQVFCVLVYASLIIPFFLGTFTRVFETWLLERNGWIRIPAQLENTSQEHGSKQYRVIRNRSGFGGKYRNTSRQISGYRYFYSYTYQGRMYNGNSFSEGPSLSFFQEETPRTVGKPTRIWIDPKDPSKSLFNFPAKIKHLFVSCFTGGVLIYLFYRLKKWIEGRHPELSITFRLKSSPKKNPKIFY